MSLIALLEVGIKSFALDTSFFVLFVTFKEERLLFGESKIYGMLLNVD